MDMKEEMMNDAIDDAMGDEDDEDERWVEYAFFSKASGNVSWICLWILFFLGRHSDAIVSQVLDELGLNLSDELSSKNLFVTSLYIPKRCSSMHHNSLLPHNLFITKLTCWITTFMSKYNLFVFSPCSNRPSLDGRQPVCGRGEEGWTTGSPGRCRCGPGGETQ